MEVKGSGLLEIRPGVWKCINSTYVDYRPPGGPWTKTSLRDIIRNVKVKDLEYIKYFNIRMRWPASIVRT